MTDTTTAPGTSAAEGTEVDTLVRQSLDLINKGTISLDDLLKVIAPKEEPHPVPVKLPIPASITAAQRKALSRLASVFGKVVPAERRVLQPTEIEALAEERAVLDEIAAMTEKRKADIRTTIFNHFDCAFEDGCDPETAAQTLRDKDGHYVASAELPCPEHGIRFTREVRKGSASLSLAKLEALVEAGELDREDFLAMTTQTRVVDPNKIMLVLKRKPGLIHAVAKATGMGNSTISMYARKLK